MQPGDGAAWMAGGSYLVARQDPHAHRDLGPHLARRAGGDHRPGQGRGRPARAAATSSTRSTSPRRAPTASRSSPMDAHVRLAHPRPNNGARLLRRGYNFVDGSDGLGRLDAGPVLHRVPARPATAVRPDADPAGAARRAQRVHPPRVQWSVRLPSGRPCRRRLLGSGAVRVDSTYLKACFSDISDASRQDLLSPSVTKALRTSISLCKWSGNSPHNGTVTNLYILYAGSPSRRFL